MIYYFSGTGNSKYAAQKLAALTDDKSVNIASIFDGTVKPVAGKADVTGFVFPVYYGGLPEIVKRFASHPEIKSHLGSYVYCVITCGAETAAADVRLSKALERDVDLSISLIMPDNYVVAYEPCENGEAIEILKEADAKINKIAQAVNNRGTYYKTTVKKKLLTGVMYPVYGIGRTTLFFRAEDSCTGCGLCVKNCPDKAIVMKNGKPKWQAGRCQHCTACINRCPAKAIQFGPFTKNRGRYYIMNINKNGGTGK